MHNHRTAMPDRQEAAPAAPSDEALASAARGGDRQAFAELYCRYLGWVRHYVRERVADRSQHDDVVQDIFARALADLGSFHDDGEPHAFRIWLFGAIARRVLQEHGWRRWAQAQAVAGAAAEMWRLAQLACAPSEQPRELRPDVAGRLDALSLRSRQIVELRYLEGLPVKQVATLMGLKPGVVTAAASLAMRKLGRPAGVSLVTQHKRNGTAPVYRTPNGWAGYAYVTGSDGTRYRKQFHCPTREAAVVRWADLTGQPVPAPQAI